MSDTVGNKSKVTLSDAEWQKRLTPEEYKVTRKKGTERAFSGKYHDAKTRGIYTCKCCGEKLFHSNTKFDSGTGWPSYWRAIDDGAVGYSTDRNLGYVRQEVHCADCGGHLGHVFDDGPKPTNQRYCINSVSLTFVKK